MEKLLAAGLRVFDERGYQAARVDDVVKAAKTSHGTFYLYFSNKDDLFRVLAEECAEVMTALADELGPVGPDADGYAALREWLSRFVTAYRRYGPIIRTWSEAQPDDPEILGLGVAAMDRITTRLAERIAEHDGHLDAQHSAVALIAMVERLNYYVLSRRITVADDDLLDTLTSITHVGAFGGRVPAANGARRKVRTV